MRYFIARVATAMTLVVFTTTSAFAAGARISWQESVESSRYKLFVTQPGAEEPVLLNFSIKNPERAEDGSAFYDVHGLDPQRSTLFLMIGISRGGVSSVGSNVIELGSEGFCHMFDVDRDGSVTPLDALAVARHALGLDQKKNTKARGTIITAFEILKMAAALQCT